MSIPIRITLTALFLFGLAGGWLYPRLSIWHEDKPLNPAVILISEINCDPALATCVARGEGVSISLSLQGPVRVLTPFPVTLQLDESVVLSSINRITVSFSMVGMNMGLNRLMLEQQDPRTWRGQAMLPVCSNGRTDWRITVEIDDGHRYMSDFFTVVTP